MTKKSIASILLSMLLALGVSAQTVDLAYIDIRTGFNYDHTTTEQNAGFHVDYLNIHLRGTLSDKLSYRFRHRLTLPAYSDKNPLNATDFAMLKWQATPKFSLTAGKHAVLVGGYEYDADPINVYHWSSFINNLYQYFTLGVTAAYDVSDGQTLNFQFSQSPLSRGITNCFTYNLYWAGHITSWWRTTWSLNFMDNENGDFMNFIVLGNLFRFGRTALEVDFNNRTSFEQEQPFLSDWSLVTAYKYHFDKLNLCAKATYDFNSAKNVDANGQAYNVALAPGSEHTQIAAGAEYFPLKNRKLRLHAFYAWSNQIYDGCHSIELGLTWRVDIFNRSK